VELQISRLPIAPDNPNQEAEKRTQVIAVVTLHFEYKRLGEFRDLSTTKRR
jgi:hypothetical protein